MTNKRKLPIVLLATTLISFTTPFMGSAVNIALPMIARDFSMTALSLSWVASAFLLAASITLVPLGRLADIYGRKIFFRGGSVIFALSSLLCIWSQTESFFIAMRVVQGIGGAMIFSTGTVMLVFAWIIGDQSLTNENSAFLIVSAKLIFGILAITCMAGVFASLARGRVHKQ
ncbi:MAG: MFS transporter [Smithellaceae bacterium]|nr:MFS transporter [Smithellaceae bacterium]